jgi:diacylglycerol kinase family enzyme
MAAGAVFVCWLTSPTVEKVMLISNAMAGSVSARAKEVIIKALQADFGLEVEDTARRDHATEIARDAADRGFRAVVAFGGDGTINEVAQGLIETETGLGILPGGSTNVMARSLGLPLNAVDATAFVASRIRTGSVRRVNVGRTNSRYFLFSFGMGLDAEVVKRVESDPDAKRERGEWWFLSNALRAGLTDYRGIDPCITLRVNDYEEVRVMTAVTCKGRPFTYFKRFPVDVCPTAQIDLGLDVFGLRNLKASMAPRLIWSLFVSRSHPHWKKTVYHHDVERIGLRADRLLPVQVDGDYIGEWDEAEVGLVRNALDVFV